MVIPISADFRVISVMLIFAFRSARGEKESFAPSAEIDAVFKGGLFDSSTPSSANLSLGASLMPFTSKLLKRLSRLISTDEISARTFMEDSILEVMKFGVIIPERLARMNTAADPSIRMKRENARTIFFMITSLFISVLQGNLQISFEMQYSLFFLMD
jgi:hypothetical protein